ncbi:phosphoribosyl-AMP cyclohydrolase [Brevibacterium ravenspurgense]|uniref:phosphoribosyl-AMP cyclohydrolase n=1 Tax=Brevibacterium ravenspurgense TaxID=479117 RepID=UPI0002F1C8AE|nr:phosphoribosyl-AMP cyclohydrolase [Brevibacterium ravenspurgense]
MTDILRPEDLRYGADGLLPAVVQEYDTREVLMLAWVDAEAVRRTLDTRKATYWSRSRGEYWVKGETSGHAQQVMRVSHDCDGDTVLYEVRQTGPACHTNTPSCFSDRRMDDHSAQ